MPRRVSVEVSPPRRIVICGGGVVGASTAYALVNHPSWRSDADSCTLVESTEIAAAASGKAGGFLALDWHSKETQSLAALSFKVHSDLAEQHDGATRWGFRKIETYSVSFDETRDKFRKVVPDIPWLDTGIITQSKRIGASTNTAQCEPKLFTQALVQMAQEKGLQVVSATVDGFIYAGDRTTIQAVSARTALDQAISIPCNTFVLAAGPWSGELARRIMPARAKAIEVTGERAHSIILKCRKDLTPHAIFCRLYTDGAMRDPEIYSRPNGIAYICGAADEEPLPATAADVATSSARIRALLDSAAAVSSQLGEAELVRSQACYLPMTPSGLPLIGSLCDQIYINAGHSCWGITLGPGSGVVMAEIILEGRERSCNIKDLIP